MKQCLRCNIEMKEDYDVKVEGAAYGCREFPLQNR